MVLCFIITAAVDFLRSFNAKQTFDNLVVAYRGMADAFAGVVMLFSGGRCICTKFKVQSALSLI